ncbi:hypothetical protein ACPEER_07555 [Pasteurella sp. PK-2025]|uniref:hypothetical protein n=1 Tax=Pasteurella sp. PK-2025 TaxID=3413133 RepID=UPI003C73BB5B
MLEYANPLTLFVNVQVTAWCLSQIVVSLKINPLNPLKQKSAVYFKTDLKHTALLDPDV